MTERKEGPHGAERVEESLTRLERRRQERAHREAHCQCDQPLPDYPQMGVRFCRLCRKPVG